MAAQLTRRVVERALAGELTHHLGYGPGGQPPGENCRNGSSAKTVLSEDGPMEIAVPRDRAGSFEPLLIAKGQRRFEGLHKCRDKVAVATKEIGLLIWHGAENLRRELGSLIPISYAHGSSLSRRDNRE